MSPLTELSLGKRTVQAIGREIRAQRGGEGANEDDCVTADRVLRVIVALHPECFPRKLEGVCYVCGCSQMDPCDPPCGWSAGEQSEGRLILCTTCEPPQKRRPRAGLRIARGGA